MEDQCDDHAGIDSACARCSILASVRIVHQRLYVNDDDVEDEIGAPRHRYLRCDLPEKHHGSPRLSSSAICANMRVQSQQCETHVRML